MLTQVCWTRPKHLEVTAICEELEKNGAPLLRRVDKKVHPFLLGGGNLCINSVTLYARRSIQGMDLKLLSFLIISTTGANLV